jgi:hypothetical protein
MANYANLRVSIDKKDADNQRYGILECLSGFNFVEDTASGKKKWRGRGSIMRPNAE